MSTGALNLLVFREGRRSVSGAALKKKSCNHLEWIGNVSSQHEVLRGLLAAGELECGVADAGYPSTMLEKVTDHWAEALVDSQPFTKADLLRALLDVDVPRQISISVPEGFAYYALHPLAYSDVPAKLPHLGNAVAVVGIRSIGTTLSAVVAAGLRKQGKKGPRITVRPQGHPYNRELRFSAEQQELVTRALAENADFLVVDEGPGLSGSSFLSVAEALLEHQVPAEKITLICGHQPDFASFRAHEGQKRAERFRWVAVDGTPRRPAHAHDFIGGGQWRQRLFPDETAWPETWTSFERLKFLSCNGGREARLYKFMGLGGYGDESFQREQRVAHAGFGSEPRMESEGFVSYPWINARPMSAADLSEDVLDRLAEYCAFRAEAFPADVNDLDGLQQMAQHDLAQLGIEEPVSLRLERPVITDGRMQPHEWLLTASGEMLKTDSGSHGDDHFFPGPTDIAWDLAGAIVEWRMNEQLADTFLSRYRLVSGDDPAMRIRGFVTAYTAFRAGYCLMAANALHGSEEQTRMEKAAARYKLALEQTVPAPRACLGVSP